MPEHYVVISTDYVITYKTAYYLRLSNKHKKIIFTFQSIEHHTFPTQMVWQNNWIQWGHSCINCYFQNWTSFYSITWNIPRHFFFLLNDFFFTEWVMWKELYSSGIVKVKDLISEEYIFINLSHYCPSHHIEYNFIQY